MKKIAKYLFILAILAGITACGNNADTQSEPNAPTWQEQYDLGVRYLSEGNYEEAIIAFTAAIEIDPKQAGAYVGRGDAYILSGETEENLAAAQADYEQAIELDETSAGAYLGLADVFIRKGYYDRALEILKQGLEKVGENQMISDKINEMEQGTFADSQGKARRCNYFNSDGSLRFYDLYQYDSEGNTSRLDSYWADGTYEGYTIYYSSEDGTHHYDDSFDADGTKRSTGLRVEDENNKWLYSTTINDDGTESLARHVAQYDKNGNCIGWDSLNEDGDLVSYARYEGDQVVYYNADGTVSMYSETTGGN